MSDNPTRLKDARYDADMLRRAAEACRNIQKQAVGNTDWFDWVPKHLDWLAAQRDWRDDDGR